MSVAAKAAGGMAWAVSTSIGSRALGLAGTLVLVHFMAPDAYGVAQAAWVLVATAQQLSTLGVGLYVVKNPHAGRGVAFHATVMHLALGILALAAVIALRGPLGPIFDAPTLGAFVPLLALAALIDRASFMPEKVLVSQLRFRQVSIARTVSELSYTAVSVVLAMRGFGAWSIVWGNVARSAVRLVMMAAVVPWRDWCEPHDLKRDTVRTLLGFGVIYAIGGLAGFAARRWDNLLVTRMFGLDVAGAYALAYNLADVPAVQVGEQITDVLMASLAHMERDERRRALVRTVGLLALIMFPLAAGLGSIASSIANTFLNRAWAGVAPMLAILAVLSVPRPMTLAFGGYLVVCDRLGAHIKLECANVVLLLTLIATLGQFSPYLACAAVGITFTLRALATIAVVGQMDQTPVSRYLAQMLGPLLACGPMIAAVLGTHVGLRELGAQPAVSLLVETAVGAIVFVPCAFLFAREQSEELLRLARKVMRFR